MTQPKNDKRLTTTGPIPAALIEKVLLEGDLSKLTPEERLNYYQKVCESLGLNPLTKPFDYIVLDRKLVLYARKDCTEQLRKRHEVSITELTTTKIEDVFVVTAKATDGKGRTDAATGAVSTEFTDDQGVTHKIKGVALANAIMKAETKAKRRVTLSLCGLGMFDESELDTVTSPPAANVVERNVREATAHVVGEERSDTFPAPSETTVTDHRVNDFGPLVITPENYKELTAHIGKAQGRILGYKIGEMDTNVIKWLYEKWRDSLPPGATEQDMRLKKAVEFAYHAPKDEKAGIVADTSKPAAPAIPEDIGAKQACITDLRQRIEDLVLTEEQACQYLHKFGLFGEGWKTFDQANTSMLLHLCSPQGWGTFKELYEREAKPKVVEKPVKEKAKGRKRASK